MCNTVSAFVILDRVRQCDKYQGTLRRTFAVYLKIKIAFPLCSCKLFFVPGLRNITRCVKGMCENV